MKAHKIILILLAICASFQLQAQKSEPQERDIQQWLTEMREYKHEFLAKQLDLKNDQKKKFFEIYDKMDDEIAKVNAETRAIERKINDSPDGKVTDLEYDMATQAMVELKGKECEIEKNYYEQLRNVLTKKQLFKLKKAERDFSMKMMRHHHQNRQNNKAKQPKE